MHGRQWATSSVATRGGPVFTLASWNVQADRMKPGHDGNDRSALETCVGRILAGDNCGLRPDIVILLELQRCKRQMRHNDCRYCAENVCRQEHAEWAAQRLRDAGYDGEYHKGEMAHTVALFFRTDVFARATHDGRMLFCTFDGRFGEGEKSHKGAVLALLRHVQTGRLLLSVAAHLSVPIRGDGSLDTAKPLGELAQLRSKIGDVCSRMSLQPHDVPLVIAGDFNSVPRANPGHAPPDVYELLTRAPSDRDGWGLSSAYGSVLHQEPTFTAWGSGESLFLGCIDYVLFSPQLGVCGVWDVPASPPTPAQVPLEPSDHLPVVAQLLFR